MMVFLLSALGGFVAVGAVFFGWGLLENVMARPRKSKEDDSGEESAEADKKSGGNK